MPLPPEIQAKLAALFPEIRRRYHCCQRKIGYASPEDAEAARQRRQPRTDEILRAYPCTDCGMHHLTSKPMTREQILAEQWHLLEDLSRYDVLEQEFARELRRFRREMGRRVLFPHELDAAFARHWDLYHRCEDLRVTIEFRRALLAQAHAADGREVTRLDRALAETLTARAQRATAVCDYVKRAYLRQRAGVVEAVNRRYGLPRYDWCQPGGIAQSGRGRRLVSSST